MADFSYQFRSNLDAQINKMEENSSLASAANELHLLRYWMVASGLCSQADLILECPAGFRIANTFAELLTILRYPVAQPIRIGRPRPTPRPVVRDNSHAA